MEVPPGLTDTELNEVRGCVQALSEYTPRFTAVTVPAKGIVWFALRAAMVVSVRTSPIVARAITDSDIPFLNIMMFCQQT